MGEFMRFRILGFEEAQNPFNLLTALCSNNVFYDPKFREVYFNNFSSADRFKKVISKRSKIISDNKYFQDTEVRNRPAETRNSLSESKWDIGDLGKIVSNVLGNKGEFVQNYLSFMERMGAKEVYAIPDCNMFYIHTEGLEFANLVQQIHFEDNSIVGKMTRADVSVPTYDHLVALESLCESSEFYLERGRSYKSSGQFPKVYDVKKDWDLDTLDGDISAVKRIMRAYANFIEEYKAPIRKQALEALKKVV